MDAHSSFGALERPCEGSPEIIPVRHQAGQVGLRPPVGVEVVEGDVVEEQVLEAPGRLERARGLQGDELLVAHGRPTSSPRPPVGPGAATSTRSEGR